MAHDPRMNLPRPSIPLADIENQLRLWARIAPNPVLKKSLYKLAEDLNEHIHQWQVYELGQEDMPIYPHTPRKEC